MLATPPMIRTSSAAIRVLIAEDDPNTRSALFSLLNRAGFDCRTAEDGLKAIEAVGSFRPEIILMDLMMPGLDGVEATKRLKTDTATHSIPILALTANATPSGLASARTAGCDDIMAKPVMLDKLVYWVRSHARR